MRRLCFSLYAILFAGALCALKTVCSPVVRSILKIRLALLEGWCRGGERRILLDLPVQTSRERDIVVLAKASIQHRRSVLKLIHQASLSILNLINIEVLVPRCNQELVGLGRKSEVGDHISWWWLELELISCIDVSSGSRKYR